MSTHPLSDADDALPISAPGGERRLKALPGSGPSSSEPLRLLYVSHSFPPQGRLLENLGGMQRVATELRGALAAHPRVRLTTRALRTTWAATPYRVGPFLARMLVDLPWTVARERIDAVLFSSPVTAALALPLRPWLAARGVRLATITYGLDLTATNPAWRALVRATLGAMDDVFAISRATAEASVARGATRERVRIVPCGVDLARFPPVRDRGVERRRLEGWMEGKGFPVETDALLVAGVGRHVRRKGFTWFVERVMPLLPPSVVFLLAGDGPETPAIREAVARGGLQARVRVLGRVEDAELAMLYRGADLFVMPNVPVAGDMEGFGVVALEAGLAGLPTVASALEGILDAVTDGANGDLVPAGDARAFANAVLRYHRAPAWLAERSARAREWVASRYGWNAVADLFVRPLDERRTGAAQAGARSAAAARTSASPHTMP
jgi:phosphatidylinositol alpha-1,6-mannosyltransferase